MKLDFKTQVLNGQLRPIPVVEEENRALTVGDCFITLLCGGKSGEVKRSMDKWALARAIRQSFERDDVLELTQSQMSLITEVMKENQQQYSDMVIAQLGEFINF